jgi:predicted XRE-type DNA-binding protein
MRRKSSAALLARELGIPKSRAIEAQMKAKLTAAIAAEVKRRHLTHANLAERSGLARTTVTGILSGSLQRVSLGRILRLTEAAGLEADVRIRRAA